MHKVSVIGHQSVIETVVERLQRAGVMQVTRTEIPDRELPGIEPDTDRLHDIEARVANAQFVRDFLGRFHTNDQAFGTFISEKIHISEADFDALEADAAFRSLYEECAAISDRLGLIERERARLRDQIDELAPWLDLRLQIEGLKGTEHVVLFAGVVPLSSAAEIRQALRDVVEEVSVAEVGRDARREAWVVMAHRDVLEDVRGTLALTTFQEARFACLSDYPAEESARAQERVVLLDNEEVDLLERAAKLSKASFKRVSALVQALLSELDAVEVRESFASTERTFLVSGWVTEERKHALIEALASIGSEIDLTLSDPVAEDVVPVELKNRRLLQPFEVLTDLYGRPTYHDVDPTPLLAGFFFLFFGMCIGDVGYGLMLGAGAWYIKTKLDVAPGVRKFMDLLLAGALASILWGILTRSYFAMSAEKLPGFLLYEPVLDPLPDLVLLLAFSVALGVVHVSLGVIVNMYRSIKVGDWAAAVQDDASSLLFFASVGVGVAVPAILGPVLLAGFVIATLLKGHVIEYLVAGRIPRALLGIGGGLLGMYGMVGYASDFLSYTRLAALGLASLMVGDVMNRLAELASGAPWGIGLLAAALILIVGHTFNVVINLLGAFVHPTRLQFVEFFGKFYEGGGRPFAPFSRRTKQLVLHPSPGEQEGGSR